MVAEHKGDLSEIKSEVTTFTSQLAERLADRHLKHPVPGKYIRSPVDCGGLLSFLPFVEVLALIEEIETEVHEDEVNDEYGAKLFEHAVQLACAFAKLPDVEDENAPKGLHDGFISRLREALEPISNELALTLRLFKAYRKANGEYTLSLSTMFMIVTTSQLLRKLRNPMNPKKILRLVTLLKSHPLTRPRHLRLSHLTRKLWSRSLLRPLIAYLVTR